MDWLEALNPLRHEAGLKLRTGPDWLHEPKFGWRLQIVKDGDRVAVFTRGKHDISKRFAGVTRPLVPCARSCVIDAELLSSDGNFWKISTPVSLGHITIAAFDLMYLDGVDLRPEPLVDRKARLTELVTRADLPNLIQVAHFDDGAALLAAAEMHGLEGVVSKKRDAPYRSGRRPEWVKVKSQAWLEANRERWRAFIR